MDTNDQHFVSLCRTCMNELVDGYTKPQQSQSIFERIEECGAFRIAELLTNAVPQIEVESSDELPKKICYECLQQLLSVHRFQQMCVQSEQQLRQKVSKKQTEFSIPATAMDAELETINPDVCALEHSSILKSLLEKTEQVVKPEAAEINDVDIYQLLEDCRDSQGNLSEFVKNEPIEDDESDIEDSDDGDTIHSVISAKDEALNIECEEQQVNEMNVETQRNTQDADRPYECIHCSRRFSTISNRNQHKAIHEEGHTRVACDICGKSIIKNNFKKHKLVHSDNDEKAHKCEVCDKSFDYFYTLRRHMLKHTDESEYKCNYCERSFYKQHNYKKHIRLHLGGDNIYRCEFCPLEFLAVRHLRLHLTKHKHSEMRERNVKALKEGEAKLQLELSEKVTQLPVQKSQQNFDIKAKKKAKEECDIPGEGYECPYCPRKFSSSSCRNRHKAIHEGGQTRVACDICGTSILKENFKSHQLLHSGDKAHKCEFCEMRFSQMSNLRVHIRKHTGEKPYKCKYCERSFAQSSKLVTHMRVHLGDNVHRCELCPLAFPAASQLRVHFTTHKNEDTETRERNMKALKEAEAKLQEKLKKKKVKVHRIIKGEDKPYYECPYCPRRFSQISNMNRHKAIHQGVKREDCGICGKSIVKSDLKNHKRIHSDEKVYKCDFCQKRFVHNCNLRAHIHKHTGEKPFKCKYCERSFSRAANLFEHMRVHFDRYIYRCELCPLAFPVRSELLKHFSTHKNEDSETREQNIKALQEAETELHLNLSKKDTEQSLREESLTQFETNAKPHHISLEKYMPHECPYCPLRFRVLRSLSWHKKIHEGVHQVACDICGKIISKKNLKSHQLTHEYFMLKCASECNVTVREMGHMHHLRRHMLQHTGEKPYKCKYCELAFTQHTVVGMRILGGQKSQTRT